MKNAELEEFHQKISVAREAILQDLKRRFKEDRGFGVTAPRDISRFFKPQTNYFCGRGKMACPVCTTGILTYDRNSYNGHVSAQCSDLHCVGWQE
jgi:hypothetical protein